MAIVFSLLVKTWTDPEHVREQSLSWYNVPSLLNCMCHPLALPGRAIL